MVAVVLAIVVSTAAGVWAEQRWGGRAGIASRRSLLFVLYVVLPPTTFFNLAAARIDADVGFGIVLAIVAVAAATGVAYLVGSRLLRLERASVGSMLCCALVGNTGYLGYAMVAVLLGFDRLSEAAVYDILVAAPALLLGAFSVGAAFGTEAGEGPRERVGAFFTRNPPLYAALLGLLAPDSLAPDVLVDASRIAIVAVLPLGFFAVGAALAEEAEEGALPFPPPLDAPVAAAVAIKLVVAPALLFALAVPLIDLPGTYLLLAAMPCGINTMIVTHAYGLDLRLTASAVAWSTAIAVSAALVASLLA
ncbi:MAG TPA: AEC family transporter [Solirubrobacterales bacterium]|nr:AEC family transporter [Solirubrobacterales bacterium]